MAGDWIKMRSDLYRDPKICIIADLIGSDESDLSRYVNQNLQCDMSVTRNVTRNATVGALVSVWGVLRHRGKREDLDLVVRGCTVAVIDDLADIPGFGEAMQSVGWVVETKEGIVFPRFFEEFNVDPASEIAAKNAERQRRYREKKGVTSNVTNNVTRNVTRDAKSNAREEERREEKVNNPPQETTDGTEGVDASIPDSDGFAVAHGIDWLTIESEFAKAWNATANTSKCRSGIAHDLAGKFRECWLTPGWKDDAVVAMAKIPESTLGAISLRQFLTPSFFESLLGGTYGPKPPRGKPAAKPESSPPAKPPKTALDRITFEMLPNPRAMVKWWLEACDEGICESTEVERLNIVGAGVRARMGDIRDGVKWFVACVRERAWDRIGDEADEIARLRLKELDHGGPARPNGELIAEIMTKLRGVAVVPDSPEGDE